MAAKKRTGLGKGISSLIPTAPADERDVDVFFNGSAPRGRAHLTPPVPAPADDQITADAAATAHDGDTAQQSSGDSLIADARPTKPGKPDEASGERTPAGTKRSTRKTATKDRTAEPSGSSDTDAPESPDRASAATSRRRVASTRNDTTGSAATRKSPARSTSARAGTRTGARAAQAAPPSDTSAESTDESPDQTTPHEDGRVAESHATESASGTRSAAARRSAAPAASASTPIEESTYIDSAANADPDARTREDVQSLEDATEESSGLAPVPGASLTSLDPSRIVPNARQPRTEFDQEALDELIVSVREFGVLQPIVVRRLADEDPRRADGEYELIMGERRLRATKASGRTEIPAVVRHTDDVDMLRDALLENLHRAELNPLEEASAYRQLLDDFGITQEQLASRIGRSRPRISNTLRLLNLPVDVQRKVAAGVLSAGHARAVLSVGEPAAMTRLADKILNEELSVRQAEAAAAKSSTRVDRTPESARPAPEGDTLAAHLVDVGERLGDRLNTRVRVALRKTKGQITIDFASVADLHRILADLGETEAAEG